MINIGDREKMFRDHTRLLAEKRRTQFRKMLEDTPKVCVYVFLSILNHMHTIDLPVILSHTII